MGNKERQQASHAEKYAWTVPFVLFLGMISALILHESIDIGILLGYGGAVLYARSVGCSIHQVLRATWSGVVNMWRVSVVLLLIGVVIALWMAGGTIPTLTEFGAVFIHNSNVIWIAFLLASGLSMVIGSSLATWGILGPPILALTPPQLYPVVAGALVSGGMVGDRSSPMSTSVLVMSQAVGLSPTTTLTQLLRTVVVPIIFTFFALLILSKGVTLRGHVVVVHDVAFTPKSLLYVMPAILVIGLALWRVSLLYNLLVAVFIGGIFAHFATHESIDHLLHQIWNGYPLALNGKNFAIGGVRPMLQASLLIFTAGAFQGVTSLGGAMEAITERLFARITTRTGFVAVSYGLSIAYTTLLGSQSLSLLMSGNTLLPQFTQRKLRREVVLRIISDSAELVSAIVPWNLLGFQAAVILKVSTLHLIPYAWFIYSALTFSAISTWRYLAQQLKTPFLGDQQKFTELGSEDGKVQ
ncbi:Na+/H+ antiporter NhaC family protein [Sulfoacidibacillus thermotolerans]|uniref:Na+/H+ antiporter NhaC family protein n=1 Tax=Sulfoacidibacillus thermotolerans TaxID=1765684 RepID=UPI001FE80523|nr:Na+/H+ antiporter NhaC family protein [Sulfoacidibacillus thermotolerans]